MGVDNQTVGSAAVLSGRLGMLDPEDTIAAITSPSGPAYRGIIRLSGPAAWSIAAAGFEPETPAEPSDPAMLRRGDIRVAGLRNVVPGSILFRAAPRTYTGQHLAEIHTLGSPPILKSLLSHYLNQGARLAEPGEFTLRAFLSGRIDLTQSEAVLGVIDAQNPEQLEAALRQLAGGLSGPIGRLRDDLLDLLAHIEAGLDFTEEPDVDEIARTSMKHRLDRALDELDDLGGRFKGREREESLPRVVLIGSPNAGKSRLFNALSGNELALVSPRAGTTRDYLSSRVDCDGLVVELIDTAGVEAARDLVEARASDLRDLQAARADLLLEIRSPDTESLKREKNRANVPCLIVWNKSDLADNAQPSREVSLSVSAVAGTGLPELRSGIASLLRNRLGDSDLPAGTASRCRDSLTRAGESVLAARTSLLDNEGDELIAIDLRQAVDDLGRIVGETVTEDILDRIFKRFCIGK